MRYPKRYLVTAALPYANGPLHIGHLAGAYISSDIYCRFLRMMDKDVVFVCGSDEHGAAITLRAIKDGVSPQSIIDKYHGLFKEAFDGIGISFDIYHRTSAELHHETSQEFFKTLYDKGEFVEKVSEQYYDEEAKQFLADRYIIGQCPKCSTEGAYGDQCESCGSSLSPTELINPTSTLSGAKPVLKTTKHWFLPLDKYESWLKEWVNEGTLNGEELHDPEEWKKHVLGQCKSWLDGGLHPRAMTRDLDWGVDVPQEIEGADGKKLYVWMDAPIGYISATKEWAKQNNTDWEPYWKDADTELVHFIGKDNIVFHCLIFPAILNAHGGYILPKNVPANQFVNLEGDKISTSKNWAIWVNEYLKDLPGKEDELRYHMIKTMPEQKDSEFTWKGFQDSVNNELVNNLANFVNRVIVLTNKYYDGVVPEFDEDASFIGVSDQGMAAFHETELMTVFDDLHYICDHIRHYEFRAALKGIMELSTKGNQLLQFNEPWKLVKEDEEAVKSIMNLALQYVTALSVVLEPFLPFTSAKIRGILQLPKLENGDLVKMLDDLAIGDLLIPNGHKIGESLHIFTRLDDELIEAQIQKLQASKVVPVAPVEKVASPIIQFDDFTKLDLRVATVVSAEKVKKADKLLKIGLDLGNEQRTVVSGIAKDYKPEDIIGKQVTLLANLAPRKIRGVESQGMILMAADAEDKLCFINPDEEWEKGSRIS